MEQASSLDPDRRLSARLLVDLDAIATNFARLAALAPGAETSAVVKADAYGLGAPAVARRLVREGCRTFFVATLEEGAELRRALGDGEAEIWVLNGYAPSMRQTFVEQRLGAVLNSPQEVAAFLAAPAGPCALHIDTGMNRLGLSGREARALAGTPGHLADLDLRLVMSHFASSEDSEALQNRDQLERFDSIAALFPGVRASLSNTGGIFLGEPYHKDLTRPGIGLYGATASAQQPAGLEPVAILQAPVLQLRQVSPGEAVGYGATYIADSERITATVAAGYADGLPRALSGRGFARLGGAKAPILGRVSMDLTVIDVTDCQHAVQDGASAEFFGADLPTLAGLCGTLPYELLTGVGARVSRAYGGLS